MWDQNQLRGCNKAGVYASISQKIATSRPSWNVSQLLLRQEHLSLKCLSWSDDPLTWCSGFLCCFFSDLFLRRVWKLSCSPPLWSSVCIAARQAVKNTPKRLPSVTLRSPLGASPPNLDSQTDSSVPTPSMDTGAGVSEDTTTTTHSVVRTLSLPYILV